MNSLLDLSLFIGRDLKTEYCQAARRYSLTVGSPNVNLDVRVIGDDVPQAAITEGEEKTCPGRESNPQGLAAATF
jgi:hypothetical protein